MKVERIPTKLSEWKVKSESNEKEYAVSSDGKNWYCSCPSGVFTGFCKHIKAIQQIND